MKKIYKYLCKIEELLCGISITSIVILVFLSAISRSIKKPIQGVLDIAQFLFAWAAFFGADVALRECKMVGVDVLVRKFSKKTQWLIDLCMNSIMLAMLIALIIFGTKLSIDSFSRSFQTLKISYSYVTFSLPVGCFLMSITVLLKMIEKIRALKQPELTGGIQ